jgi:hypothetical protein
VSWVTTGKYWWCVACHFIVVKERHTDCEGPHRPVAVLLFSPDEYRSPEERKEVTMQIEDPKVPLEETTRKSDDLEWVITNAPVDPERYYCVLYDHVKGYAFCAIDGYDHLPKDETHGYHQAASFKKGERSAYIRYVPGPGVVEVPPVPGMEKLVEQVTEELVKPENDELLKLALFGGTFEDGESVKGGDWVLIRGQLLSPPGKRGGYQIRCAGPAGVKSYIEVADTEIIAKTDAPAPPEPHHGNILVSMKEGTENVFLYQQGNGEKPGTWVWANTQVPIEWEFLYATYGPFREHYASRPMEVQ